MEVRLLEHLEDICQKQHVCLAVKVAVFAQGLAPKGFPDLLRVGVGLVAGVRVRVCCRRPPFGGALAR